MPGGASAQSALVMVQGLVEQRLVIWPLNGDSPPQEIDIHVNTWPLLVSPDNRRVLYSTPGTLMVFDVEARRATIVGELPEDSSFLAAEWSPDGNALVYILHDDRERVAYYALADGSQPAVAFLNVHVGMPLDVGWLADGRPMAAYVGIESEGGLVARPVVYEPTLNETLPLSPNTAVVHTWIPWVSPDGTQFVYSMYSWEELRYQGRCRTSPLTLAGEDVMPTVSRTTKLAFEMEGMYMDWPTWLDDGRIIFRGIAHEACTTQPSGLFVGYPGEKPTQIVETGFAFKTDEEDSVPWGTAYAVSPNQRLIAWSQNDEVRQQSTVYLTPVDGGTDQVLMQTEPPVVGEPFDYADEHMILQLVWLP